jgi:catechol 2,3-dioxygenase
MSLPASTHPGQVVLQVADLARSVAYYTGVIGFRILQQSEGKAVLGAAGPPRPLVELRERVGAHPAPPRGRLGLYHFAILVPDRPALGRFLAHLGSIGVRPGMSDHLVSEALYLSDPDGLGIEVYADRSRDTWRHRDGQIAMAVDPLDADSVVRSGRGEPWTGMPAGTTIGHVHLYVGDLEAASAFYHAALGLDRTSWNYPGALFLSAGGYHHHLGVNTWAAGAPRATERDARLIEWELRLPAAADVAAAGERLAASGSTVTPTSRGMTASDPWGTTLRILGQDQQDGQDGEPSAGLRRERACLRRLRPGRRSRHPSANRD